LALDVVSLCERDASWVLVDVFEVAKISTSTFPKDLKTSMVIGDHFDKKALKMVAHTTFQTKVHMGMWLCTYNLFHSF
jgi:hypothetical protein